MYLTKLIKEWPGLPQWIPTAPSNFGLRSYMLRFSLISSNNLADEPFIGSFIIFDSEHICSALSSCSLSLNLSRLRWLQHFEKDTIWIGDFHIFSLAAVPPWFVYQRKVVDNSFLFYRKALLYTQIHECVVCVYMWKIYRLLAWRNILWWDLEGVPFLLHCLPCENHLFPSAPCCLQKCLLPS